MFEVNKKRLFIIALSLICLLNVAAVFEKFNYLEPDQFKEWLDTNKPVIIVDIQVKDEFTAHHFQNSIETNAFPVKTDSDLQSIDPAITLFKRTGHDVVVVCPRGGGGAKRCYSHLKSQGVPVAKLTILKGGVAKWPYPAMLVNNK